MKPPLIIGALGGSGTRVVARIVQRLGYFLGSNRNESEDAMEFVDFYDRWINRYLLRDHAPLCEEEERLMQSDFIASVARHRLGVPSYDYPWGWKEPRSHFLLPVFHAWYPEMKFIHLIRDGRDMAFSSNQNQLRKHGAALVDPSLQEAPPPVRAAALWAKVNMEIASFAEKNLTQRCLIIRFERLCAEPLQTVALISHFLGVSVIDLDAVVADIVAPETVGRWQQSYKTEDPTTVVLIQAQLRACLTKFGYDSEYQVQNLSGS